MKRDFISVLIEHALNAVILLAATAAVVYLLATAGPVTRPPQKTPPAGCLK